MTLDIDRIRWDDRELDKVTEMVSRRVVVDGATTIVWSQMRKGALVPVHAHAGEQAIHVKQGALAVTMRGVRTVVSEGEALVIPAGVPHEVEALEDALVVDVRGGEAQFRSVWDGTDGSRPPRS